MGDERMLQTAMAMHLGLHLTARACPAPCREHAALVRVVETSL